MANQYFSDKDVIANTRKMIHLFLNKQIPEFMESVSDDFVWIGDYDALYTQGASQFRANIQEEDEMPDVFLSEEEYTLLSHDRTLWVTYGRCVAETKLSDITTAIIKFHFTLTWKRFGQDLKLIHAMACHVPDSNSSVEIQVPKAKISGETLNYRQAILKQNLTDKKLVFPDSDGGIHYLYANEILYIQSNGPTCTIHTKNISFPCYRRIGSIQIPELYRVSKSYLVNKLYVTKIERFTLTLTDGTKLPISRTLYMDFKKKLGV